MNGHTLSNFEVNFHERIATYRENKNIIATEQIGVLISVIFFKTGNYSNYL